MRERFDGARRPERAERASLALSRRARWQSFKSDVASPAGDEPELSSVASFGRRPPARPASRRPRLSSCGTKMLKLRK